jgi:hypothetical protein
MVERLELTSFQPGCILQSETSAPSRISAKTFMVVPHQKWDASVCAFSMNAYRNRRDSEPHLQGSMRPLLLQRD